MSTTKEYRRLRAEGWRAQEAWRAAKIAERWEALEDRGLVRMRAEEEREAYEPSGETPKQIAQELASVELYGNWWVVAEYRVSEDDEWEHGDSIGMMAGWKDPLDTMYTPDLREQTMNALDALFAEEARDLGARATFAGVSP